MVPPQRGAHQMSERPTVADYVARRLAREGITNSFGVAGDFAFKLCDAVARSDAIRWIGCSNELDAAYAADGYARVRGCSILMTTYEGSHQMTAADVGTMARHGLKPVIFVLNNG